MAIRATTNHKALYAGISFAKLSARARLVKTYSTVKNSFITLQASTVQLTASALTVSPFVLANWQNITLAGIKLNTAKSLYAFSSSLGFEQSVIFNPEKRITSDIEMAESHFFSLDDKASSSFSFTDYEKFGVGTAKSSSFSISDAALISHLPNYRSDVYVQFSDLVYSLDKQMQDDFSFDDSHAFAATKPSESSFGFGDNSTLTAGKVTDSTTQVIDEQVFVSNKVSASDFDFEDNLIFVRDPYNFTFVDGETSRTVNGYPADEFDFEDVVSLSVGIGLLSQFGFDDTVNVDGIDKNKKNLTFMEDSATFSTGKQLESSYSFNSVPSMGAGAQRSSDFTVFDQGFDYDANKALSHAFSLDQSANFHVAKRPHNAFSVLSDTVLETNKSFTNQLSMSDSDPTKGLSKQATNSIIDMTSITPLIAVETTALSTFDTDDEAVMSTMTEPSDSLTLTDSVVKTLASASSRVNHSMVNEFLING